MKTQMRYSSTSKDVWLDRTHAFGGKFLMFMQGVLNAQRMYNYREDNKRGV